MLSCLVWTCRFLARVHPSAPHLCAALLFIVALFILARPLRQKPKPLKKATPQRKPTRQKRLTSQQKRTRNKVHPTCFMGFKADIPGMFTARGWNYGTREDVLPWFSCPILFSHRSFSKFTQVSGKFLFLKAARNMPSRCVIIVRQGRPGISCLDCLLMWQF